MRIWSAGYWRRPYERANRAQARIAPQTGFAETQDSGTDAAERSGLALSPRSRSARAPMGHRRIDRGRIGRHGLADGLGAADPRSEEHPSELPSLIRSSYSVLCLQQKRK